MKRLLVKNPEERMTADEALKHKFVDHPVVELATQSSLRIVQSVEKIVSI